MWTFPNQKIQKNLQYSETIKKYLEIFEKFQTKLYIFKLQQSTPLTTQGKTISNPTKNSTKNQYEKGNYKDYANMERAPRK
jgi:hypothetical protein